MIETLRTLLRLDDEEARLRERMAPYRARLEAIAKAAGESRANLARLSAEKAEKSKALRALELDLKAVEEKMKAEEKKLDAVASLKAAQAAEHEIAALKGKIGGLEDRILELMEDVEALERSHREAASTASSAEAEEASLRTEINACEEEIGAKLAGVAAEIERATAELAPEMRKRYLALRASHVAHPVTFMDAGACSRCRSELKPNTIAKLHAGAPMICDQCKRILVPV